MPGDHRSVTRTVHRRVKLRLVVDDEEEPMSADEAHDGAGLSRRRLLGRGATLGGAALAAGPAAAMARHGHGRRAGFGRLVEDRRGLLDLPRGFQYRVISAEEGTLSRPDAPVPGDHDGMAAFPGPRRNSTILVRNHELSGSEKPPVPQTGYVNAYDPEEAGGTTGILVGPDRKEVSDFVTSAGTSRNCSGGPTPWNTWLTCEETRDDEGVMHGYVFEVNPYDPANKLSAQPIRDMGFFSHEAVGVDPTTGIVYLTEDDFRGEIPDDPRDEDEVGKPASEGGTRASFLYRFLPNDRSRKPGALQKGGRLQAMKIDERSSFNVDLAGEGKRFQVRWVRVRPEQAHEDALAKGAARFNRLEGADFAGGAFWFDDTAGGRKRLGQIFRYLPATNTLELFFEGRRAENMQSPDNLVIAPWGDVWFCEDGEGTDRVMGITPEGVVYRFARNAITDAELAGCAFSPDGRTFFVNIQSPGLTFAIWGPFPRGQAGRRRQMAAASPPDRYAPQLSGTLAEAAERHGMSPLEVAAFDRLGVSLA